MAVERGCRANWFAAIFYEEDLSFVQSGLFNFGYKYAMIKHNNDSNEDGTEKKEHWHLVVLCDRREFQYTLAKRLGLDNRKVQAPFAPKPNGAIRYLLHLDNADKPQYDRSDIVTNITDAELDGLFEKIEHQTEDEKTENLLNDVEALARNEIGYRAFLKLHPNFIYQTNSLLKLVQIAQDWRWSGINTETGEVNGDI